MVVFEPLETAFPLAVACPSLALVNLLRKMNRPPRKKKTPMATIGIYRTNGTFQHLASINEGRDVHTQITGESPVLALSRLGDCLACTVCHGAPRTSGMKAAGRIIDSMDMIMRRG